MTEVENAQKAFEEAEAALAKAKAKQANARPPALIEQLKAVRAELRELRPRLAKLKDRVLSLQAEHENIMHAIGLREDRVSELLRDTPACAEFLEDDPDVLEWRRTVEALRDELARLRAALSEQPNLYALRVEGVEIATRISSLQFSEASILNQLAGTSGKSFWGGKAMPEPGGTLSGVL